MKIKDEIKSCLDEMDVKYHLPGISVAVIHHGEVEFYSKSKIKVEPPLHKNARFGIGCCTKTFVSCVAALVFREYGLDFDTPLQEYFPAIKFCDSEINKHLTMKDLLSHRTGFPKQNHSFYFPHNIEEKLLQIYEIYQPVTELRRRFQYNNLSYLLVGLILKHITGNSLEKLLEEKIFLPLHMEHTGFSLEGLMPADLAIPHLIKDNNELCTIDHKYIYGGGASGGLYSTMADLSRWILPLLNRKYTNHHVLDEQIINILTSPIIMCDEKNTNYLSASSYGMGWFSRTFKGTPMFYYEGRQIGYSCMLSYIPDNEIGIIAMTNTHNHIAPQLITYSIYDILLQKEKTNWPGFFKIDQIFIKESQETAKKDFITKYCTFDMSDAAMERLLGTYQNELFGTLSIQLQEDNYILMINEIIFSFHPYRDNIYCADIYGSEQLFAFCKNKIIIPIDDYQNPSTYIKLNP